MRTIVRLLYQLNGSPFCSFRGRIAGRTLELEHLITAGLLLTVGLGTLVLDAGGPVRCFDLAIVGACVGLFLILSCC